MGVLKTVQMHTRSKHVFTASTANGNVVLEVPQSSVSGAPQPVVVRRNSTSAPLDSASVDSIPPPLPTSTPQTETISSADPAVPQSVTEPVLEFDDTSSAFFSELRTALNKQDAAEVFSIVQRMKSSPNPPSTAEVNLALEALHLTRHPGDPLNILLDTYNHMIQQSVVPNIRTYLILILALTDRDHEIHKTVMWLESKSKRRLRADPVELLPNARRIELLRSENNFASAMSLFEAATAISWNKNTIPHIVYANLLRSCAYHSNIDAALHVFANLETRPDILPSALIYSQLINVYTNIGDLSGAKDVMKEYRAAISENRVAMQSVPKTYSAGSEPSQSSRAAHLIVWNRLIEAHFRCGDYVGALSLLEQMMDNNNASNKEDVFDVPPPASSTFTHIIAGFCQNGDVASALSWFDRLLQQDDTARHPQESLSTVPRPDQLAWVVMLETLAIEKMVPELNRLFSILMQNAARDGLAVRAADRILLFEANIQYLDTNKDITKAAAIEILDFLSQNLLTNDESDYPVKLHRFGRQKLTEELADKYVQFGDPLRAFNLLEPYIHDRLRYLRHFESLSHMKSIDIHENMVALRNIVRIITSQIMLPNVVRDLPVSFENTLRVLRLSDATGLPPTASVAPYFLHAYALSKERGEVVELMVRDWELLMYASTSMVLPTSEQAPEVPQPLIGTVDLLEDLQKHGVELEKFNKQNIRRIVKDIFFTHDLKKLQALFTRLGPDYERVLNNPARDELSLRAAHRDPPTISKDVIVPAASPPGSVLIDVHHSRYVEEFFPNHPTVSPLIAYSRFESGAQKGIYPVPSTIGRLINALGRLKEMDKVRMLYNAAQLVISTLEAESHWQSHSWFQVEDQMVIACAHAGELDAAFQHRERITAQGGVPSADAYGALIECVKDTTDDTSNAVSLYREAMAIGCRPNVYMFNTIISKLAKARKADFALELFQEMKASGTKPSSITYGAVIAACARVGDVMSAEQLFQEMVEQPNFKPRIPPYNTMMQLYTQTKPDRDRVRYFYHLLTRAQIPPSAHTYKVS
jgi:pentatricopeptide repeat protein